MKVHTHTAMAALLAGVLGAYAWAPVYSATQDSGQTSTQMAPAAQSSGMQSPAASEPAEKIMPGKGSEACARLDKNHDGYISKSEFKASGKPAKLFKSADIAHHGKLNMEECSKALAG